MEKGMKKRWISLYVENQVGILSKNIRTFLRKILQSGQPYRLHYRRPYGFQNDHSNSKRR